MAFTKLTKNVLNVSSLPDRVQNQAQALKATFDQAGVDIKEALNTLIAELEAKTSASNLGADVSSVTTKTVQAILTAFEIEIANRYTKNEIDALVSGNTNNLVADVDINLSNGVITVTKKDGTKETYDTAIEKVPAKFEIVESGTSLFLKITNVDGTSTQTDITELMNIYDFNNSNEIAFNVSGTGNEKVVTASIRPNSIGLDKLSLSAVSTLEGYMISARDSANAAKTSETNARNSANTATKAAEKASIAEGLAETAITKATEAESYAHGGTGTREGEDTDNAKYYSQIAKEVAGGDFVTVTEMEAYAQKKGTSPDYETKELSGEVIETDLPLAMESNLHISGNSEQDSRSGKNLFNKDTCTDGYAVGREGIMYADQSYSASDFIEIKSNTTYTRTNVSWINEYDDNKVNIKQPEGRTFTTSSNARYLRASLLISNKNIAQLEEGTESTEYEPYGAMPSPDYPAEIRSVSGDVKARVEGKNLIGKEAMSTPADDTDFWSSLSHSTPLQYGWCRVKLKGEGTNTRYSNQFVRRGNIRNIKPSTKYTFYIEFRNVSNKNPSGYVSLAGNNASEIWKGSFQINTIEVKEGLKICKNLTTKDALDVTLDFRIFTAVSPSEDIDFEYRLMILEGEHTLEEIGEYVQDKTLSLPLGDIQLRSTPDGTRDTFKRVDGVWNKVENVGSVVLDGSDDESWEFASASTIPFRIMLDNAKALTSSQAIPPNIYCQFFKALSWDEALEGTTIDGIVATATSDTTTQKVLRFRYNEIADLSTFKTWLASNPVQVDYVLAIPTYTPITDEALIQALDELEQLILHKGYNRITVTSVNGVKAYLELEIYSTASVTNVVETETSMDMIVPVVSGEGDIKVKIPKENKMTLNPSTGEIKVGGKAISTEEYVNIKVEPKADKSYVDGKMQYSTSDLTAGTSELTTDTIYLVYE